MESNLLCLVPFAPLASVQIDPFMSAHFPGNEQLSSRAVGSLFSNSIQDGFCSLSGGVTIRPHSSRMHKRWVQYEKQADSRQNGEHLECFDSSRFMLPGGTAADISRVFKETFDMELPICEDQVSRCKRTIAKAELREKMLGTEAGQKCEEL